MCARKRVWKSPFRTFYPLFFASGECAKIDRYPTILYTYVWINRFIFGDYHIGKSHSHTFGVLPKTDSGFFEIQFCRHHISNSKRIAIVSENIVVRSFSQRCTAV
ncbi:unnamed protein product [Haemonchus placei]|uniref:Uncharacterized protein n=1 Tax=Haemonchus placei TaxID=6290 RepID=A0A3P7WB21_HAEPC|nr:unnamed protein product [Haemonchus placei]